MGAEEAEQRAYAKTISVATKEMKQIRRESRRPAQRLALSICRAFVSSIRRENHCTHLSRSRRLDLTPSNHLSGSIPTLSIARFPPCTSICTSCDDSSRMLTSAPLSPLGTKTIRKTGQLDGVFDPDWGIESLKQA
jgi:DNA-binding XRE family transcriptional regulator